MNETKVCPKCGIEFEISMFGKNKQSIDGLTSYCKNCCNSLSKQNYKNKKDDWILYNRKSKIKNIDAITHRQKIFNKKGADLLSDRYVKSILISKGYTSLQINNYPELIETQRIIIKTKRLCKALQNSENQ